MVNHIHTLHIYKIILTRTQDKKELLVFKELIKNHLAHGASAHTTYL